MGSGMSSSAVTASDVKSGSMIPKSGREFGLLTVACLAGSSFAFTVCSLVETFEQSGHSRYFETATGEFYKLPVRRSQMFTALLVGEFIQAVSLLVTFVFSLRGVLFHGRRKKLVVETPDIGAPVGGFSHGYCMHNRRDGIREPLLY